MDKDEEKAALVIQKHARGRKTRQSFRRARRLVLFMFRGCRCSRGGGAGAV